MGLKKGFFFSSDAFIALMLFIVVLLGIYSYVIISNDMQQQYIFSEDLLNLFGNVTVGELPALLSYYPDDPDSTVLELIAQNPGNAGVILNELTGNLLGVQYGFGVYVDGEEVYNNLEGVSSSVSREKLVKNGDSYNITRFEVGVKS